MTSALTLTELFNLTYFHVFSCGIFSCNVFSWQVVRFVDSRKTIQQRVLTVKLLETALYGDSLAAVVVESIYSVEQKPLKVRYNTVDGCATNGVANTVMKALFRECCDIVCMSHSFNLSMELFQKTTKTAHKFISLWSQCLTQGHKVRAATQLSLGEKGVKTHAIRWLAEYRAVVQVYNNFEKITAIIKEEDVGCASLISQLVDILEEDKDNLLLELALIFDSGYPIASFCNHFEGDGYLAPYVCDEWNKLNDHMTDILEKLPHSDFHSAVRDIATSIAGDDVVLLEELITNTSKKTKPVAQKLESDTQGRLRSSLQVFKGCRMLGYQYIKANTIEALEVEFEFIHFLPVAVPIIDQLRRELRKYKQLADAFESADGWTFWRSYYNSLPTWYKVAADVALIMTSSASVERVFSLLNSRFSDQQQRALRDYKEGSVRITYNERFRDNIQYPV